jgi:ABC-type dipeptide/oligopeptide/nickel transport system permease subunit
MEENLIYAFMVAGFIAIMGFFVPLVTGYIIGAKDESLKYTNVMIGFATGAFLTIVLMIFLPDTYEMIYTEKNSRKER